MDVRAKVLKTIFLGSSLYFAVPCFAQLGTGSISGFAQDPSGAVIPGVSVTLVNPGTVGGNQQTTTDERGGFQFIRLVPGTYSVKAESAGLRTSVREGITVNADNSSRVDFVLEVGAVTETVTITAEPPLLDTTSTLNQAVLTRQVLDSLPNGKDVWSSARAVPAVLMNSYDVGGSQSYRQATPQVHGSSAGENKYLVDGMDVSDNSGTGNFVLAYFDPNSFEEVNVQTGSAPAERSRGGVVYNLVTKTGTNAFHGAFHFVGSHRDLQSNNLTPALRSQLLAAVPRQALAANPNLEPDARIFGLFNSSTSLSGPIWKDRLWFSVTGTLQSLNQPRIGSYNSDGTPVVDDGRSKNFSSKISWQVNQNNQLHFSYSRNIKDSYHRTIIANQNFFDNDATWVQRNLGNISQLKWTSTLSPRLVLDVSASVLYGSTGLAPQANVLPGTLPRFDAVTLTYSGAADTNNFQPSERVVFNAGLSYIIGHHDLKVGFQSNRSDQRTYTYSTSNFPSGLVAVYRNGVPDSVNTYNTPVRFRLIDFENGVFVQDKWTPFRKLTMTFGVRFDTDKGRLPAACQPATIFISAQCFTESRGVPDFMAIAPRFGLVYDIFGDGKTALKVSANRYNFGTGPGFPSRINPLRVTSDRRPWVDSNGDRIPQLSELGASTGFNLGTTNRYSPDVKWPYSNELAVEIERRLARDFVVAVAYYHRETRNNIGSKNLLVPATSYTPIQVIEKTSGKAVTVYNQDPATRGRFDTLFDNFSELDSQFNGVDFKFTKRLSKHWMAFGGLSLGRNHGDNGTGDLNNPNFAFRRGLLSNDVPVAFKFSGVYELPFGVRFSGNFQHFTGFPEDMTVRVASDTVALTQVSQVLRVSSFGTTRLPDVNMLDFGARKTFRFGERFSTDAIVDAFNVGNSSAIQARTTQLGPTYQTVSNMVIGRLWRFGLAMNF